LQLKPGPLEGGARSAVDQSDVLHTLAEVSVAFAGFSGVVAVFGRRDPSTWSVADRIRFSTLIEYSLFALFFCVLPSCLSTLHLPEEFVWCTASGFFAAYLLARNLLAIGRLRAAPPSDRADLSRSIVVFLLLADIVAFALNLYNVVTLREIGPFLLALLLLLTKSGFLFARMLLLSFRGNHATS
jgi:hypothetical protein